MLKPKVAIVYLSYHCEPYIEDVVASLKNVSYPKDRLALVVVDNPHPVHGLSMPMLEDSVLPLSGKELPEVILLPQKSNLGFAGGNNVGIQWALENGFDYILFHNNDGMFATGAIEPLVEAMEKDKTIGIAQSLILLYPETDLINSSGNAYHYLGMAYCANLRVSKDSIKIVSGSEIGYAMGAAVLMRADLLRQYGLWDPDYFMYHEDLEYCFRLKSVGYKSIIIPESIFYHKYSFGRSGDKFYYIERNRIAFLLSYFKWPTLLLILPMAIILDFGLILFAWKNKGLMLKMRVYKYWLNTSHWQLWLKKRKYIQAIRTVKDRDLLKTAVSQIIFDEKTISNPLLKYVGNPMMAGYWWVVKKIIAW